MKFGKEFTSHMVPEWKEAYMDYDCLKTLLKEIQSFKQEKPGTSPGALKRKMTMYRTFSGLIHRSRDKKNPKEDIEDQVIVVNAVQREDSNVYDETKFHMPSDEGSNCENSFFRRLDEEFNKVDMFYKNKVEEVVHEAVLLNKQMDALIALRVKVDNPDFDGTSATKCLATDVASLAASAVSTLSSARMSGREHMDVIQEVKMSGEEHLEKSTEGADVSPAHTINHSSVCGIESKTIAYKPAPLEILERVKINNTLETPMSTIKGVLKDSKDMELRFRKEELRKVEDQLKQVFIEFYQKLHLLKRYSFMNLLAFSKVMKKYDKITSRRASRSYLKKVDNSFLGSSDEITTLMERVEATFIKHFSNSNRKNGMEFLRPRPRREKHRTTFLFGFFSGCAIALVVALVFIIHARNLMNREGSTQYMENMFPLYSLFAYIVLHMLIYAANIYFWRRYRVNYPFIFGFKQGTELSYREVFLLSAGLAVLTLASVLANLDMEMDSRTQSYQTFTELVPLVLVCVLLVIVFCPFNIMYQSSRFFIIQCIFRCFCALLYKVTLPDSFLADQLTSQVQAIRCLEFYICYYGWGDFKRRRNSCRSNNVYNGFYFIVAIIPYWVRFLQCLRRWFEEKDVIHGYNGLKYFLTITAVVTRTAYDLKKGMTWKVMAAVSSAITAIISTYWDIVIDWGLLQRHSKNRWLRDKLLVSHSCIYFAAMVLNILLRFAWLQSVLDFNVSFLHRTAIVAIIACLEILRRGIWNFFRLENEHLNNVGKYRAFKSVPLPFNYYGEDKNRDE